MKRRILAILLAAIMVLSAVPFSVFATEGETAETVACPGEGKVHGEAHVAIATEFKTVKATCGNDGYIVYTCNVCDDQFIVITEKGDPNDPHNLTHVQAKAPTCVEKGCEEHYFCSKCEKTFNYVDGVLTLFPGAILDKVDHDYKVLENDCTRKKCTVCGHETDVTDESKRPISHKYEVVKLISAAPTCKDKAKADVKCVICGDMKYGVEVASDVPHTGKKVAKKDATCTDDGWAEHWQCTVCNKYFLTSACTTAVEWKNIVSKAPGHDVENTTGDTLFIERVEPKCDVPGYYTYECGRCHQKVNDQEIDPNPSYFFYVKDKKTNKYVMNSDNKTKKVFVSYAVNAGDVVVVAADKFDFDGDDATHVREYILDAEGNKKVNHRFDPARDEATAPTCTEYGYAKRHCLDCGKEVNSEILPPLGHVTYVYGSKEYKAAVAAGIIVESATAPTCSTGTLYTYTCDRCKVAGLTGYIAPLGHAAEKTVTTANCTNKGVTFTYAPVNAGGDCTCGKYTKMSTKTYDAGKATERTYTLWDPATVKVDDKTGALVIDEAFFLVKGGKVTETAKNGVHVERTQVVNKPTCTETGTGVDLCIFCGENESYVIPETGHKVTLTWDNKIAEADRTLLNSDQYKTYKDSAKVADDAAEGIVAATCIKGSYLQLVCETCGGYSDINDSFKGISLKISKELGHDTVTVVVSPTCGNGTGATGGYTYTKCSRHGTADATDKCWNDENNSKKWTNKTTYSEKTSYTEDEVEKYHPGLLSGTKTVYKAGSCTVVGLDQYTCSCGRNVLVIQGDTGAHIKPATTSADYYNAKLDPTCVAPGKEECYKCQRCKEIIGGKLVEGDVVANEIKQLKHNPNKLVFDAKAPKCTNVKAGKNTIESAVQGNLVNGYWAVYTCTACGKDVENKHFWAYIPGDGNGDGKTDKNEMKFVYLTGVETEDVYKIKDGKITGVVDDNTKVKAENSIVKRVEDGHRYESKKGLDYTCTTNGYTAYSQCKDCGDIINKKTLKAAHRFDDDMMYTQAQTCTDIGYTSQACRHCDYVLITNYKAAKQHDFDVNNDGKLNDKDYKKVTATCTQAGGNKFTCQNGCGEWYFENGGTPMLSHKNKAGVELAYGNSTTGITQLKCTEGMKAEDCKCKDCGKTFTGHVVKLTVVDPTCDTAGYTIETCTSCKAILSKTTTKDALNHEGFMVEDLEQYVAESSVTDGQRVYVCSKCGFEDVVILPAKAEINLDLTFSNPNANGEVVFADSSVVEVLVSLSSPKADIRGLSFGVKYDTSKFVFQSAEFIDTTFSITAVNDNGGVVKFAAMSNNKVAVGEAKDIAVLRFVVNRTKVVNDEVVSDFSKDAATGEITIVDAEAHLAAGTSLVVNVAKEEAVKIVALLNVYIAENNDAIDMQDALAIYDLITNKGYNVAADLDKSGAVDAYDLQLFYNYFVGSMTAEEIFAAN